MAAMQRTSESIATLAAALAKAQIELVNPEKTLVATIPASDRSGAEKIFRYASLSSGLEIVRKVLGQHQIATVQMTSIDQAAGIVKLTTVLAHSSGEWIASDWPVCPVGETDSPRRMGAALTYARRYALFTLVGIAGEDDLDAPDLMASTNQSADRTRAPANASGQLNGGQQDQAPGAPSRRSGETPRQTAATAMLGAEASVESRNRLIAEVNQFGSSEEAALWAHRSIREKNRLIGTDAHAVEEAFQARLSTFGTPSVAASFLENTVSTVSTQKRMAKRSGRQSDRSRRIDKGVLSLPEPRRVRDREHVKFVAQQACLVCGRRPTDAHHLRFAQSRALSRKVSDEFTVPVCRGHHREIHRCGDEAAWWKRAKIDPSVAARTLWLRTHPLARTDADIDKRTSSPI
jgi:ERF superfamily